MAEVSYNPATGQFEEGSHTQITQRNQAKGAVPDTAAFDASENAHRYRNEGRWIGADELARGTGIERTIRNGAHPVLGRDYRGSDTIEIQGQRMSLDIAASLGFVKRNGNGGFSFSGDAEGGAPKDTSQGNQQAAPGGDAASVFRASDDAENAITALTQTTMEGAQIAALNAVVETGEVDERTIERLAQQSGQSQEQIASQVQQVYDGFHGAITSRMEGLGVHDLELFDEFVQNDGRLYREMKQAVRNLMMSNDTSGFDRLATSFTEALDQIDPEAVMEALDASGIRYVHHKGGPVLLHLPGHGQLSYREAVKLGLIKVRKG